jgi:hypothetical protein
LSYDFSSSNLASIRFYKVAAESIVSNSLTVHFISTLARVMSLALFNGAVNTKVSIPESDSGLAQLNAFLSLSGGTLYAIYV